ncbi:MAG: hypothetical protein E7212_04365 [Clostridium sartagoforme]|nr:hypothetical protein [Clostridium sartagoforme]
MPFGINKGDKMFKFHDRRENLRRKKKELFKEIDAGRKPKFKELVSIMIAQYLVILPIVFGVVLVFMLFAKLLLLLWE